MSDQNIQPGIKRLVTFAGIGYLTALFCLPMLISRAVGAEDFPVPARVQVPIFLKILTFDRNFEEQIKTQLKIGLIYTEEDPSSRRVMNDIAQILDSYDDKTIKGLPISYVRMRYTTEQNIEKLAKSQGINVFYVAPGNAGHLAALLRISQKLKIITITGVPQYVEKGVTIGLGLKSDNKTRILINLNSALLEGIVFDANLLRLSTIVQQ